MNDKYQSYRDEAAKVAATTPEWWKPTKSGETITGKVISYSEGMNFDQKVIKIDSDDGKIWLRGVNVMLEKELNAKVIIGGEVISIIYRGENKSAKGVTYKRFEVILHERPPQSKMDPAKFKANLLQEIRENDDKDIDEVAAEFYGDDYAEDETA
jgi:hypothetical protein